MKGKAGGGTPTKIGEAGICNSVPVFARAVSQPNKRKTCFRHTDEEETWSQERCPRQLSVQEGSGRESQIRPPM